MKTNDYDRMLRTGFGARITRLSKLFDLGAPDIILYNEARMLFEFSKGLGSGKIHVDHQMESAKEAAEQEVAIQKNYRDVCATPGCDNSINNRMRRPEGERICSPCLTSSKKKRVNNFKGGQK